MLYSSLVSVDQTGLKLWAKEEIKTLAKEIQFYEDDPINEEETIARASHADALLVSWRTPITKKVIAACPHLKYIGMCCSLYDEKSANVDIAFAHERGIHVRGVRDYGDEGLVEFILSELIRLLHGFGDYQFREKQEELTHKKLGIIGFGTTGQMLASRAQAFGMQVIYYSRTRKEWLENDGVAYRPLHALLREADIVSTHLPKHSVILKEDEFDALGEGKILVNTSLEPTFDLSAFKGWMSQSKNNFAILDRGGLGCAYQELRMIDRVITTEKVSGFTVQAEERLSEKVVANLRLPLK